MFEPVKIAASPEQKAFYTDLSNQMIRISRWYKSVSGIDMVAILGRIAGVLIAQIALGGRPMARTILNENVDQAIALINPEKKEQDNAVHDTAKDAG